MISTSRAQTASVLAPLLGLIGALGCNLGPFTVLGKRCSAERPCSGGLVCANDVCADPDAGIPYNVNLLGNPTFEIGQSGLLTDWILGPSATFRRWSAGDGGVEVVETKAFGPRLTIESAPVAEENVFGTVMCARVLVRAIPGGPTIAAGLNIREHLLDGGIQRPRIVWTTLSTTEWKTLADQYQTIGQGSLDVRAEVQQLVDAGLGIVLSEATLFRSQTTSCEAPKP
jgi:hypothetical protein